MGRLGSCTSRKRFKSVTIFGHYCLTLPTYLCCVGGIRLLKETFDDLSTEKMIQELGGRTLAACDVHQRER